MKTSWNARNNGNLLPIIAAAVLALFTMSCEEDPMLIIGESDAPKDICSGNIRSETFWVIPEGTRISLLDGDVLLDFPEGSVAVPTRFTLASFPLHHRVLDGHNYYNRRYALTDITSNQKSLTKDIKIHIRYDLDEKNWMKGVPGDPDNLTLLYLTQDQFPYDRVVCIENCRTDFFSKVIRGCICECGSYVLGEKRRQLPSQVP